MSEASDRSETTAADSASESPTEAASLTIVLSQDEHGAEGLGISTRLLLDRLDQIASALRVPPVLRPRMTGSGRSHSERSHEAGLPTLPVTIYLSAEEAHGPVEAAVDALLTTAGLQIYSRDDPVEGSWFRRMKATLGPPAREAALVAAHMADTRLVLAQDAAVTATLMQGLAPVIASLQPTKDAVVRLGAVLIVKVDWIVTVNQLTAAQQAILDHRPELASAPQEILIALKLSSADKMADSTLPAIED